MTGLRKEFRLAIKDLRVMNDVLTHTGRPALGDIVSDIADRLNQLVEEIPTEDGRISCASTNASYDLQNAPSYL